MTTFAQLKAEWCSADESPDTLWVVVRDGENDVLAFRADSAAGALAPQMRLNKDHLRRIWTEPSVD